MKTTYIENKVTISIETEQFLGGLDSVINRSNVSAPKFVTLYFKERTFHRRLRKMIKRTRSLDIVLEQCDPIIGYTY